MICNFSYSVLLTWCLSLLIVVDIDCKFFSNIYNFPADINKPEYLSIANNNNDKVKVNLPIDSQRITNITQLSSNFIHKLIANNEVHIVYNSYNELDINVMKTNNISNIHNNITIILDISHNIFKSNIINIIYQVIKKLYKLQVLILDYNQLHYHDVRNLISILRRHSSIQQLSLSSCSLTDGCMGCIANLLKMNSNITSLDISNNHITEIGFSEILDVLQHHSSSNLIYLDLSYNKIGNHGISLLINLLENNKLPKLQYLLLKDVGIDRECVEKLLSVLNLRAVRYYSMKHISSYSTNNVSDSSDALMKTKVVTNGSLKSKMVKKRKDGNSRSNSSSSRSSSSSSRNKNKNGKGNRKRGLDSVNEEITISRLMVLDISGNQLFVRKTNRKKIKKLPDFLTMSSLPTLFSSILNTYGSSSSGSSGVVGSSSDDVVDDVDANVNVDQETISTTTATNIRYGRKSMKTMKMNKSLKIQKIKVTSGTNDSKKKLNYSSKLLNTRQSATADDDDDDDDDDDGEGKDKPTENRKKILKKKNTLKIHQSQVSSIYNSMNKSILELMMMIIEAETATVASTVADNRSSFYLGLVETGLNDVWCSELIEMIVKEKKRRKLGKDNDKKIRIGNNRSSINQVSSGSSSSSSSRNIDDDDNDDDGDDDDDDNSAKVFKTGLTFNIMGNDVSTVLLTKLLKL